MSSPYPTYEELQAAVLTLSFAAAIGWGLALALVLLKITDRKAS